MTVLGSVILLSEDQVAAQSGSTRRALRKMERHRQPAGPRTRPPTRHG